jgi:excisionase family DNA binding protein
MEKIITDQISISDLVNRLALKVKEINEQRPGSEPLEKYLTRKETAKLLQVSLVTLNEWSKKGIIQSYRIGGRIRYKYSEINESLKEVKNLKYRRA